MDQATRNRIGQRLTVATVLIGILGLLIPIYIWVKQDRENKHQQELQNCRSFLEKTSLCPTTSDAVSQRRALAQAAKLGASRELTYALDNYDYALAMLDIAIRHKPHEIAQRRQEVEKQNETIRAIMKKELEEAKPR